jgi:hypothetical protein
MRLSEMCQKSINLKASGWRCAGLIAEYEKTVWISCLHSSRLSGLSALRALSVVAGPGGKREAEPRSWLIFNDAMWKWSRVSMEWKKCKSYLIWKQNEIQYRLPSLAFLSQSQFMWLHKNSYSTHSFTSLHSIPFRSGRRAFQLLNEITLFFKLPLVINWLKRSLN